MKIRTLSEVAVEVLAEHRKILAGEPVGNWRLTDDAFVNDKLGRYEVAFSTLTAMAEVFDWIFHLAGKGPTADVQNFIRLLDMLFDVRTAYTRKGQRRVDVRAEIEGRKQLYAMWPAKKTTGK